MSNRNDAALEAFLRYPTRRTPDEGAGSEIDAKIAGDLSSNPLTISASYTPRDDYSLGPIGGQYRTCRAYAEPAKGSIQTRPPVQENTQRHPIRLGCFLSSWGDQSGKRIIFRMKNVAAKRHHQAVSPKAGIEELVTVARRSLNVCHPSSSAFCQRYDHSVQEYHDAGTRKDVLGARREALMKRPTNLLTCIEASWDLTTWRR